MTLSHLRAGVIGTGFIGPVHVEALKRLGVQVTALCGSTASATALAEKWGVPEVYDDYDVKGLLESPNVDVVHIASPNKVHVEQATAALKAGKHIVCEKPLGMTTKETSALVKAAAKARTVFAVNYNVRFYPAVLQMRAMVQRGELGHIIHAQGHFFQDWLLKETDYNWRLHASEGGSLRAVGDIGTHWMDTLSFILGTKVESVFATLETFHKKRLRPKASVQTFAQARPKDLVSYVVDTEDFASLLLQYHRAPHGFAARVHANASISQVAAGWKTSLALGIYGTEGSVRWDMQDPDLLHAGRRDQPNETRRRCGPGFLEDIRPYADYPAGHAEGFPDSHKMNFRCIYEYIASGKKTAALFASAEDGHEEIKLCEAIQRANRAQRWMKV